MNEGTSAAASKRGHTNGQDRSDSDRSPGPPYDCDYCQWAFECGSRAWSCDACQSSHDLRDNAQLTMIRDDGSVNQENRR